MRKGKKSGHQLKKHINLCKICNHAEKEDIEIDYMHCVPMSVIEKRYGVNRMVIMRHADAFGLDVKRDRKNFYWRVIESVTFDKLTVENAIEAAKQLDRLEHKIDNDVSHTNIQVVYSFGKKEKKGEDNDGSNDGEATQGGNRLSAFTDTGELPSL